jgi:hypothetical protein
VAIVMSTSSIPAATDHGVPVDLDLIVPLYLVSSTACIAKRLPFADQEFHP